MLPKDTGALSSVSPSAEMVPEEYYFLFFGVFSASFITLTASVSGLILPFFPLYKDSNF